MPRPSSRHRMAIAGAVAARRRARDCLAGRAVCRRQARARRRVNACESRSRLMRILIVSHGFPPSAGGGAEIYANAHASELARGGDEVFVITREADARRPEYSVRR